MKVLAFIICALSASSAFAAEPVGCDKFKWPVDRERAAISAPDISKLQSGNDAPIAGAALFSLRPEANAALPKPPERAQKPETFAGFINLKSLAAGTYEIVVSDYAWIDVLQAGNYLKPMDHSGATGCDGIRKIMKFKVGAGDAVVQFSGVADNAIKFLVWRDVQQ